ncbi:nt5c2 [Symbiodinium pilosum]|uniref:Nt5c2 protein n=1 Tax=Symbiodinium pilosum TaxID=2952 RepID=A0A812MSB4_SYMPI|nr:nt5c2 [Symbiodinium pilosum]
MDGVQVIGYDLDYTLVHYRVEAWEGAVYTQSKEILRKKGFDVEGLEFDPDLIIRGLVIDSKLGNIVKVDRYGYVRKALHGMKMLSENHVNKLYGRQRCRVDLRESRWSFINTLFSVASGCLFAQLVERADGSLSQDSPPLHLDYAQLARTVRAAVSEAHVTGVLKEQILKDPSEYVQLDSEAPIALLDQKLAGKNLVLITNNDWEYTQRMMSYAYDRFLPSGLTWRALFDVVITNARKPDFWTLQLPLWEVVDEERGLTHSTPRSKMEVGHVYCGGNARMVEGCFGHGGQEVMYVGDHIYADTNVARRIVQWRTCLIMRELEEEVRALATSQQRRKDLGDLLVRRDRLLHQRGMSLVKAARSRLGISTQLSLGHGLTTT